MGMSSVFYQRRSEILEITKGRYATPTGSRVICNPPPLDTDEDWLVLVPRDISAEMQDAGFSQDGSPEFYTGNDNGGFRSWRRGDLNIVTTESEEFYQLFETATMLAKRFNLQDKNDRVALFQAILYNVRWHNLQAETFVLEMPA